MIHVVLVQPDRTPIVYHGDERYVCIHAEKAMRDLTAKGINYVIQVNGTPLGENHKTRLYLADVIAELSLESTLIPANKAPIVRRDQ